MCPVNVHWHVKSNYNKYWNVKMTITNFNYRFNYTHWTLVVQHPNLNKATKVSSFVYKPLMPNLSTSKLQVPLFDSLTEQTYTRSFHRSPGWWYFNNADDTALFYGRKAYNDVLMQAGPKGNVHSDLTLEKDRKTLALKKGWAFPRRVYFNGNPCVMPSPESYPYLPNSAGAK